MDVDICPEFQNGSYSFYGGLSVSIDNQDKHRIFNARITDSLASLNDHCLKGVVEHWNSSEYEDIETDKVYDTPIVNGVFGIAKSGDEMYVHFPDEIPGDKGWRYVGKASNVLNRGTPTYIRISFYRHRMKPHHLEIEEIEIFSLVPISDRPPS